jgi:LPXTG-motif cell wall-anchored protein
MGSSRMAGALRPSRPPRRLSRTGNSGYLQGLQAGRAEAMALSQVQAQRELALRRAAEASYASSHPHATRPNVGQAQAIDPQMMANAMGGSPEQPQRQSEYIADILEGIGVAAEGLGKGWGAAKGAASNPSAEDSNAILPTLRKNMGWLAVAGAAVVGVGYWFLKRKKAS